MPTRVLTGYIPGAEALTAVQALAWKLKDKKHDLIYLLDRASKLCLIHTSLF